MAMRRAAQSLVPRLLQNTSQGFAPLATAPAHLPWLNERDSQSSASSGGIPAIYRGYSTALTPAGATDVATAAAAQGLPPTVYATRNPNAISYDEHVHDKFPAGDPSKRAFTYFVLTGGRFIYASALRVAVLKLIVSMTATKDVLAMAALEIDLAKVEMGQTVTVKWRGKPVFVRRRTEAEIGGARSVDLSSLRDPETDEARTKNPEWLVVVGVCTHLGCVPLPNAGEYHGWFCPCHGSHYDTSGRVRKGPAPYNLEVPDYKFLDETTLMVG